MTCSFQGDYAYFKGVLNLDAPKQWTEQRKVLEIRMTLSASSSSTSAQGSSPKMKLTRLSTLWTLGCNSSTSEDSSSGTAGRCITTSL